MSLRFVTTRVWAFVFALLTLVAVAIMVPPAAHAQSHTFSTGHIDAFNVKSDSGELTLNMKEDVTGLRVERAPEDVVLHVADLAYTDQTASLPEVGQASYYLPQAQNHSLIWPGWDTLGAQQYFHEVDIHFVEVSGPGDVYMFGSSTFGGAQPLLASGNIQLTSGDHIHQAQPAHVHTNWAFTEPGTYTMRVQATGTNNSGQEQRSNTATYTWVVGGDADSVTSGDNQPAPGVAPAPQPGNPAPAPAPTGGSSLSSRGGTPAAGATTTHYAAQKPVAAAPAGNAPAAAPAAPAPAPATGGGSASEKCTGGLAPTLKDDRTQPAQWVSPASLTFGLGEAAETRLPMAIGPVQPGDVYMIGSTQVAGVPWLGANTQHESVINHTTGAVTWKLTSFEGPGNMVVYTQGNLGQVVGEEWFRATPGAPQGSHTVPANTHVHPNWVFSKPGTYKVGITQSAELKSGGVASGSATLTFIVGGQGNANDGHFDFGTVVDPQGNCEAGASAGGAGAAGAGVTGSAAAGSSAATALADTGVTPLTAPFLLLGIGIVVLGASYIFSGRVRKALS